MKTKYYNKDVQKVEYKIIENATSGGILQSSNNQNISFEIQKANNLIYDKILNCLI